MLFQEQVDAFFFVRLRAIFSTPWMLISLCVRVAQMPSITGFIELSFGPFQTSALAVGDFFGPSQTLFDFLLLRHFHDLLGQLRLPFGRLQVELGRI